jgi:cytochrome o ubiquinol oxidase operon protein cyoD
MEAKESRSMMGAYVIGFVLSLAFTIASFVLVERNMMSRGTIFALISGFAVAQFLAQVVFFLHLGREPKTRWNLLTFGFMLLVLVIVVFGSLWIMANLNYNMMSPKETNDYIIQDEGIR